MLEKDADSMSPVIDEKSIPIDSTAVISISKDKMTAGILLKPAENGGWEMTLEGLKKKIEERGVVYGIDEKILENILDGKRYNQTIEFAKGKEPVDEKDAEITFHFNTVKNRKPKINENGHVDFHDLGLIENVQKGTILCTKIPVVPGVFGRDVTGKPVLYKKGRDRMLPMGKNTRISEDGCHLIADKEGYPDYTGSRVNILDTYLVTGDVGPKTGDIDYIGNVVIIGDVNPEYNIRAKGNIIIHGTVGVSNIEAEGSILLSKGINGMGKSVIRSGEDITSKYIENCYVFAGGSVKAENILNSTIDCKGNLELIGRKAALVGGNYEVGQDIIAKTIGSYAYVRMHLNLGKTKDLYESYQECETNLANNKARFEQLDKLLRSLQELQSAGTIDPAKKSMLDQAIVARDALMKSIGQDNIRCAQIMEEISHRLKGKVVVKDKIYPGVSVHIGKYHYQVEDMKENVIFMKKDEEVKILNGFTGNQE